MSFLTNPDKDHTERLAATQRKRTETSPNKTVASSPSKDNQTHDEVSEIGNIPKILIYLIAI